MTTIQIGDKVRIFGTLYVAGAPTDPAVLRLEITAPDTTVTTYIYGTDPEIVRESVGAFYYDLSANSPGEWSYAWFSDSDPTAFKEDTIDVAWPTTITTVDDQSTPQPVPFTTVKVWDVDNNLLELGNTRTDPNGQVVTGLTEGSYRLIAFKLGWVFDGPVLVDLTGNGPFSIQLQGRLMQSNWLQWEDLECTVDRATIDRLFNDDNLGVRDTFLIEGLIQQAEALAESKLRRSWKTSQEIALLARGDKSLRVQAAWLAIEMATERKQEFISSDGKGRYWAQYERALQFFDDLSKSKTQSRGEEQAGPGANSGGSRRPVLKHNEDPFVFAPGRNGRGPGGF